MDLSACLKAPVNWRLTAAEELKKPSLGTKVVLQLFSLFLPELRLTILGETKTCIFL